MTSEQNSDRDRDGFDTDDELRALLGATDPAGSLTPADPSGVARLMEDAMHDSSTTAGSRRPSLVWLTGAAAVLLVASVGIFALVGGPGGDDVPVAQDPTTRTAQPDPGSANGDSPTITRLGIPQATTARCQVPTAALLGTRPVAFQGTVRTIEGGLVTLLPTKFYAGRATDLVEVQRPSGQLGKLVGSVDFMVGETYLVAATDGEVSLCGFSDQSSPRLESLYERAFSG